MTVDPDPVDVEALTAALGVAVAPDLLTLALTHRSYAYEHGQIPHNERLEFLGDAILGQAVTIRLYQAHPDLDEGALAKRRAAVVSTGALAQAARAIGLGDHIRLGRGERLTGGADKDSILADTMEAVIGAAFLSAGGDGATGLVMRLIEPLMTDPDRHGAAVDPKTALQELVAARGMPAPAYRVEADGPDHARVFTATVSSGEVSASGTGTSKKHAEMAAALRAWRMLTDQD